jgi:hypothetical protein
MVDVTAKFPTEKKHSNVSIPEIYDNKTTRFMETMCSEQQGITVISKCYTERREKVIDQKLISYKSSVALNCTWKQKYYSEIKHDEAFSSF